MFWSWGRVEFRPTKTIVGSLWPSLFLPCCPIFALRRVCCLTLGSAILFCIFWLLRCMKQLLYSTRPCCKVQVYTQSRTSLGRSFLRICGCPDQGLTLALRGLGGGQIRKMGENGVKWPFLLEGSGLRSWLHVRW